MTTPRLLPSGLVALALCGLPHAALAENWIRPGGERLVVSAGAFLPHFDTRLRVDSRTLGAGVTIDLEDDLLLTEDVETGYVDLTWRFAERHRLGFAYFTFDRDTSSIAQANIRFNDGKEIQVGAFFATEFELDVTPFGYAYSFINNDRHELAGTVGLHWTDISLQVTAGAWVADEDATGRVRAKASGPMPLVGVKYRYNLSERWTVGTGLEFFAIRLDDDLTSFEGHLYNARIDTEYWPWNHVGFGAALNAFGLDVDVSDDEWKGTVDYDYWGPQLYLKARF